MAERLLLQGRYFSKLRKLGMIGAAASVVSGVATYYTFYVRRDKLFADYEKTAFAPAMQQKVDNRIVKLSGLPRDEKYPDLVFPPKKELDPPGERIELTDMELEFNLARIEALLLKKKFGREAMEVYAKLYFDDIRQSGYFSDDKERKKCQQAFAKYRKQFINDFRKTYPAPVVEFFDKVANPDDPKITETRSYLRTLYTLRGMGNTRQHIDEMCKKLEDMPEKDSRNRKAAKRIQKMAEYFADFFPLYKNTPPQSEMIYYVLISRNPESGPIHHKPWDYKAELEAWKATLKL